MHSSVAIIAVIALCLFIVGFLILMWQLAKRRGYSPWCWFASGLIGLVVLLCLPSPKAAENPEEAATRAKRGNIVGLLITATMILLKVVIKCLRDH